MSLDFLNNGLDWSTLEKNLGDNLKGAKKKSYADDRFWKLSRDENDNGVALIRLVPDSLGTPFIQRYSNSIQTIDPVSQKKSWYINESPQSINLPCPVSEFWSELYNLGTEEAKAEAKNFNRKINFIANIKVIKDPANPENEGKIFLWQFGIKLKDKFMQALNPSETDRSMGEEPKQLFNVMNGNNIKLKIKKGAGFLNYDDTTIEPVSSVYGSVEEAQKDIIENTHKLEEFLKPEAFLPYIELKSKLKSTLENYTPKFVSQEVFNRVLLATVNKEEGQKAPVPEPDHIETGLNLGTPAATPAPSSNPDPIDIEPVKQTPPAKAASADDDLSFLDDL